MAKKAVKYVAPKPAVKAIRRPGKPAAGKKK